MRLSENRATGAFSGGEGGCEVNSIELRSTVHRLDDTCMETEGGRERKREERRERWKEEKKPPFTISVGCTCDNTCVQVHKERYASTFAGRAVKRNIVSAKHFI